MLRRRIFIRGIWILAMVFWAWPVFAEMLVDTAWVRRYNGVDDGADVAHDLAVDFAGNVYVTGSSYGGHTGLDYVTVKYDVNGDTAWVRRYNGPADSNDVACAIVIDDSGNVYVTGQSMGDESYYDFATVKYYSNGDTAWARRYDGSGHDWDYAADVAVDASGNAYVAGSSIGSEGHWDYLTVKYTPSGDTAWVRTYDGQASYYRTDNAYAIAVDQAGNAYVTGRSGVASNHHDYATIKYLPIGDTAWVRRYDGPRGNDVASDIAVDTVGNAYVTGFSAGTGSDPHYYDYATIKYSPNGDTAWVRRYDGPTNHDDFAKAIAIDDAGNVYVTGSSWGSGTSDDFLTIKYDSFGDTAWVRRYNGPGNGADVAYGITAVPTGDVYVVGSCYGVWTARDFAITKYGANGDSAWVRTYDGGGSDDEAYAMASDSLGNVYVTGRSCGASTSEDYATIKYSPFLRARGDANGDGTIDIGDVVLLVNYLYKQGFSPNPLEAGDANCDGIVNVADIVYLVNYLYRGGDPPSC